MKHPGQWRETISTRMFSVMVGLGIIVLGVALTKELVRKIQIHTQIQELETEISTLEAHNVELNDMLTYFNSSSFQEKEARTKLGLVAPGETVAVLPKTADTDAAAAVNGAAVTQSEDNNPKKWQDYFFKH